MELHALVRPKKLRILNLKQLMIMSMCADIGPEYGDVRPLDNIRMRRLTINGVQLLDRIDPNHAFVTELGSVGCITWPQRPVSYTHLTLPTNREV